MAEIQKNDLIGWLEYAVGFMLEKRDYESAVDLIKKVADEFSDPRIDSLKKKVDHVLAGIYDSSFYTGMKDDHYHSAVKFFKHLFQHYRPDSLVDFGAGTGAWIKAARDLGVKTILGIEGEWVKNSASHIVPGLPYHYQNMEDPVCLERHFDMAMSLDVAEHLTQSRADTFLDDMCTAADFIMFGAAMSLQLGANHINEQNQTYWIEKFRARGYICRDFFRAPLWFHNDIQANYLQNTFVFVRQGDSRAELIPDFPLYNVHHPRMLNIYQMNQSFAGQVHGSFKQFYNNRQ
jgi:hypothetical protein